MQETDPLRRVGLVFFVKKLYINSAHSLGRAKIGYAMYTLGGPFTVDSYGKKVIFSKGNLQYNANSTNAGTAPYTPAWRFAPNQYDYIGSDNSKIAENYDGWIDLFGWGTGDNPTKVSTTAGDYSSFNEWGTAAAGNIGSGWYTLTGDEWDYMLKSTSPTPGTNCRICVSSGLPKSTATDVNAARFVKAVVGSVNGMIVFPDTYIHPADVSVTASLSAYNGAYSNYNTFVVTAGWEKMELAGAVFLPAAGERQGTTINNNGTYGNYYSSTYTGTAGFHCYFYSGNMNSKASTYPTSNKSYGYSVRLVKNAN